MCSFNSLVNCISLVCLPMMFASSIAITLRGDYLFSPGIGMHKFHPRAVTWNAARKICNEEGGHLAVINSIAEARVLMEIFNGADPVKNAMHLDEAYIGTHDMYEEGDWVTIHGEPLAKAGFNQWSEKWNGQPDNAGGQQNCGTFLKEGKLVDVHCEWLFPFFCELPSLRSSA